MLTYIQLYLPRSSHARKAHVRNSDHHHAWRTCIYVCTSSFAHVHKRCYQVDLFYTMRRRRSLIHYVIDVTDRHLITCKHAWKCIDPQSLSMCASTPVVIFLFIRWHTSQVEIYKIERSTIIPVTTAKTQIQDWTAYHILDIFHNSMPHEAFLDLV